MLVKSQGQKLRVQVDGARADVYESDLVFHLSTELDSGRTERWRDGRSHPIFGVKTVTHDVPGDEVRFGPESV